MNMPLMSSFDWFSPEINNQSHSRIWNSDVFHWNCINSFVKNSLLKVYNSSDKIAIYIITSVQLRVLNSFIYIGYNTIIRKH